MIEQATVDAHTATDRDVLPCECCDRLDERTGSAGTKTSREISTLERQVEGRRFGRTDENGVAHIRFALQHLDPPEPDWKTPRHVQPIPAPCAGNGDRRADRCTDAKNNECVSTLTTHHYIPGFKVGR